MSDGPDEEDRVPAYESEFEAQIPANQLTLILGGFALFVAVLGRIGPTRGVISYVDLPVTLMIFVATALIAARGEQRAAGGLLGMVLAAAAVLIAAAGLFLNRDHPWLF